MLFDYYYGNESDEFIFYRIPKIIITSPIFKNISCDAKLLYGLLLDRMSLSAKNGWFDEDNRVYIIFSIKEVMEYMNCSKGTAIRFMSELEESNLIERKKRGRGLADYIYVKKYFDENKVVQKENPKKSEFCTPEGSETEPQEVQNLNPNNTDINNNYMNYTYSTLPSPKSRKEYEEIIKENIEYDILKLDYKDEWLDNIIEIMLDVICSDSKTVRVNSTNVPIEQVRERYLSINDMHVRYLDDAFHKNNSEVRNIRAFFVTAIYNAPVMMDSFYEDWVKNDMKRGMI